MSVPVTILGGFLGAGKTTAVNHLLRHATTRTGVLVNDFGAINIDAALIAEQGGDVVALTNGCVCCAIGPDLGDSLARLLQRTPPPQRILVEASGVSDPWRIAQLTRLQPGVTLDAVIVLVDAAGFPANLADRWLTDTLERQLARADLIVVSKCDLADATPTREAVQRLRPGVPMIDIADGAIPTMLLGSTTPASRFTADAPDHGFRAWHWPDAAGLDPQRLRTLLAALPPSVLRAKGICTLAPDGTPHLLQMVGRRWTLEPWHGAARPSGLVLIGTQDMPPDDHLTALFQTAGFSKTPAIA